MINSLKDGLPYALEVKEERKKEVEKKRNLIGSILPKRGHTLFSFNKKTGEIKKAEFVKFDYEWLQETQPNRKIDIEENCIYLSVLNKKNLIKVLKRENIIIK
tara:strand:+ start:485 stop:793 length:309 start_codon:yes stop_codon:yes gene_type:complete